MAKQKNTMFENWKTFAELFSHKTSQCTAVSDLKQPEYVLSIYCSICLCYYEGQRQLKVSKKKSDTIFQVKFVFN